MIINVRTFIPSCRSYSPLLIKIPKKIIYLGNCKLKIVLTPSTSLLLYLSLSSLFIHLSILVYNSIIKFAPLCLSYVFFPLLFSFSISLNLPLYLALYLNIPLSLFLPLFLHLFSPSFFLFILP